MKGLACCFGCLKLFKMRRHQLWGVGFRNKLSFYLCGIAFPWGRDYSGVNPCWQDPVLGAPRGICSWAGQVRPSADTAAFPWTSDLIAFLKCIYLLWYLWNPSLRTFWTFKPCFGELGNVLLSVFHIRMCLKSQYRNHCIICKSLNSSLYT